jgi:hypothetical protein
MGVLPLQFYVHVAAKPSFNTASPCRTHFELLDLQTPPISSLSLTEDQAGFLVGTRDSAWRVLKGINYKYKNTQVETRCQRSHSLNQEAGGW